MKIRNLRINGRKDTPYVDANPELSFYIESEKEGAGLQSYSITLLDENSNVVWQSGKIESDKSFGIKLSGELSSYSKYSVKLFAVDTNGDSDEGEIAFFTAKVNEPFVGKWITDKNYSFESGSPVPMTFKKSFALDKKVAKAEVFATAYGIYELTLNGKKVGEDYLTPYFTAMNKVLQYQIYDVTDMLSGANELYAEVSGGWACGRYGLSNSSKNFTDKQYFLADVVITYENGEREIFGTDKTWGVTEKGRYIAADIYDGVVFDANVELSSLSFKSADEVPAPKRAELKTTYGENVRLHEVFAPIEAHKSEKGYIYDFGQNLAGLTRFTVKAKKGQKITVRHGEILNDKGEISYGPLRSAKATVEYIAKDGEQTFIASHTYMGYRYAEVMGCDKDDITIESVALYSDFDVIGGFECSDERLTRLQKNIEWGGKSNFVDIPTDCPQRDERLGWTGDIAVFSRTAAFNFDMGRFFDKWLNDLRLDQTPNGGIANVIPKVFTGQAMKSNGNDSALCGWGEACIMVPNAEYLARGDKELLSRQYDSMQKFIKCVFAENMLSKRGDGRYIWAKPMMYGDWCAPEEAMLQWFGKRKWLYTIYLFNSLKTMAFFARVLDKPEDVEYYDDLAEKVRNAFINKLTNKKGKMTKEFQSGYTCALAFGIYPDEETRKAFAENLVRLVKERNYHLGTGFLGTPYLLFALCDNGYKDVAYKVLLQDTCPSWLYEIKMGGTTVWERWDGILEDGAINDYPLQFFKYKKPTKQTTGDGTRGMLSFNHYAYGAVGDFMYRRIAGIEAIEPTYKTFKVAPVVGGGLTYARAYTKCPYGKISAAWKIEDGKFTLSVEVPCGTTCEVILPSGGKTTVQSGKYEFPEDIK